MRIPDQMLLRGHGGHRHFWQRALSRRQFLGASAAATGAAVTAPLWVPALAEASSVDPTPIPETLFGKFHVQLPGPDTELSTITDFSGILGVAAVSGTGTGTITGVPTPLVFDADMRFMQGQYIGMNGQNHEGTFVFV